MYAYFGDGREINLYVGGTMGHGSDQVFAHMTKGDAASGGR